MSLCNNIFGYEYGNVLIKEFASKLKGITSKDKIVCKGASDKFLLFVKNITNQAEVVMFIDNLHSLLRKPYTTAKESGVFTASMGIARYPNDGDDFKSLAMAAEYAAKTAKMNGTSSYAFFNNTMQTLAHYGTDEYAGKKRNNDKEYEPKFIPVVDAKTGKLVCYDYIPYSMYENSVCLTTEAYYELNKSSANAKNLTILSIKTLMFMMFGLKKSGKKIPPLAVYTMLTAEDLPGFIQELSSFTTENDCSGIDLCILLPQDILEGIQINRLKTLSEYIHNLGFKVGLYLLGARYIHNYCHTYGVFDRFVMKSQYIEHSISSGKHVKYCADTLNVLHKFVQDITIPAIVDSFDKEVMFESGVTGFSSVEEAVSGSKGLIEDFAVRSIVKEHRELAKPSVTELNPAIAYHDIVKSNLVWLFYDIKKKSFSISSNFETVLGIDINSQDNPLSIDDIFSGIHPEDRKKFMEQVSLLKMNLEVVSFDLRYKINSDYEVFRTTILCAVDSNGAPLRYQCAITKIS